MLSLPCVRFPCAAECGRPILWGDRASQEGAGLESLPMGRQLLGLQDWH